MSLIKNKQLFGIITNPFTGSFIISSSLNVIGTASANVFSGSGAGLTNIPVSAIVGTLSGANQWILNGTTLFTSASYNTQVTGSLAVYGDSAPDVFVVKNLNDTQNLFKILSTGVAQFYVNSSDPSSTADYGQIYFTSSSLYVGLV